MNDMTTFLGLDTSDFAQGLARARTLAGAEGGKLQQMLGRQQKNLEKAFVGGNLVKSALVAPAIVFGTLAKAYSDYGEKFAFVQRSNEQFGKSAKATWEVVGRAATLLFENVKSLGGDAFKSLSDSLQEYLDKWAKGGMRDLLDAQKMEGAAKALAEGAAMRRGLERDILAAAGDQKGLQLLDARIEREKTLQEIEEKRVKGLINAQDAAKLRRMVEERFFFANGAETNDPYVESQMAWRRSGDAQRGDDAARLARKEERAKARKEWEAQNRRDVEELQVERARDRIDALRLQKQEQKAEVLQAELDLWERIVGIHDKALSQSEYELAVQHARLDSAIRLEAKLRDMSEVGGVRERSIGSGLFSAALADQVFRRPGAGPQDSALKAAQENLRQQTVATSKLTRIEEATAGLLAVAQERLGLATFAR